MYVTYYVNQSGGGSVYPAVYSPVVYQRGGGLGGFLAGLSRRIFPLIGRALRPVGKEILHAGLNVLGDVMTRKNTFRDSVENRITESGVRLKRKAMDKLDELMQGGGGGYKSKRPRKSNQKGSGRGRRRIKKQKTKVKKRRVKKKIVKKKTVTRKKRTTKKKPKRDLYDVFS